MKYRRFHGGGPPVGDLAALLGQTNLQQQAVDFAVLGGSAAVGVLAGRVFRRQVLDRFAFIPDLAKPVIHVLVGFGAGIALQKVYRRAAAGLAAGLIGEAIGGLVARYLPAGLGQVTEEDLLFGTGHGYAGLFGPPGARQFDIEGMGEVGVEDGSYLNGFDIEERIPALSAVVG